VAVPGTLLCRITLAALDGSDDNDNSNVVVDVKSCASRDARGENTNGERETVDCMILRVLMCSRERYTSVYRMRCGTFNGCRCLNAGMESPEAMPHILTQDPDEHHKNLQPPPTV
jgi:hypothetical protein